MDSTCFSVAGSPDMIGSSLAQVEAGIRNASMPTRPVLKKAQPVSRCDELRVCLFAVQLNACSSRCQFAKSDVIGCEDLALQP